MSDNEKDARRVAKDIRASMVDSGWSSPPAATLLGVAPPTAPRGAHGPKEQVVVRSGVRNSAPAPAHSHSAQDASAVHEKKSFRPEPDVSVSHEQPPNETGRSTRRTSFSPPAVATFAAAPPVDPLSVSMSEDVPIATLGVGRGTVSEPMTIDARTAMRLRIRVGGGALSVWAFLAPIVAVLAAGAILLGMRLGPRAPANMKIAAAAEMPRAATRDETASLRSSSSNAAPAEKPLPLGAKPTGSATTSQEHLAHAERRLQLEQDAAKELRQRLEQDPDLIKDPAVTKQLLKLTAKTSTATQALAAMAALPGTIGADLLYEVLKRSPRSEVGELAGDLLISTDVRAKASPALGVLLDLQTAEQCEQYRDILPRALEDADRRALTLLLKLKRTVGCGANKREDCYSCLRSGDDLDKIIEVAKKRREPK